jgi:hypothetical protein
VSKLLQQALVPLHRRQLTPLPLLVVAESPLPLLPYSPLALPLAPLLLSPLHSLVSLFSVAEEVLPHLWR